MMCKEVGVARSLKYGVPGGPQIPAKVDSVAVGDTWPHPFSFWAETRNL